MKKILHIKLLFLFIFLLSSNVIAEVSNQANQANFQQKTESDISDVDDIKEALSIYSRSEDQNNTIYEQNLREMLDSIEERFLACDSDSDQTLDVYETTQCLPQVARQFREVDIDNDNLISLHEIAVLAKNYKSKEKLKQNTDVADKNQKKIPAASLKNKLKPKVVN